LEKTAGGMLKKISVTGPECSGKTTLCKALAAHFNCLWVPEMARIILEKDGPEYDEKKVEDLAKLQLEEEHRLETLAKKAGHQWLFCDTDLIVFKIWMEQRFGKSPAWIWEKTASSDYSLTLLLKPDLPWEPDPLRQNPHDRNYLYQLYENELLKSGIPWRSLGGVNRLKTALQLIEEIPS
jgi:NadR type nicotinamide-nucleotide adenylyltransferase